MTDYPQPTSVYTEGVCSDGAAILRDGVPLPISEILATLNRSERDAADAVDRVAFAIWARREERCLNYTPQPDWWMRALDEPERDKFRDYAKAAISALQATAP